MTDFFVFRHGDTTQSNRKLLGIFRSRDTFNLPILQTGVPALEKIGRYLKNIPTQANFVSPFSRCVESAKIVGKISGKEFKIDKRIRELERDGESFSSLHKRITEFIEDIARKKYSAVAICTHGAVIAGMKHLLTNGKFYFFQVIDYPSPGNLIIIKDRKVKEINFNSR